MPFWILIELVPTKLPQCRSIRQLRGLVELPVQFGTGLDAMGIAAGAALAILGVVLIWTRTSLAAICCAIVAYIPLAHFVAPDLGQLFPSRAAAALVHRGPTAPAGPIAITGFSEPSRIFLLGTDTRLLPPQDAAAALAQRKVVAALVARSQEAAFLAALGDAGDPAGTVSGLDYSNGTHINERR
jgi:hypothetical protein